MCCCARGWSCTSTEPDLSRLPPAVGLRALGTRDRICTCNTPGLGRRPLLVGIPWRESPRRGSNSPEPGRQPGVLTRGQRGEEKEEPPARFELANPAFGGLGPFLLAAARVRSAGFEPAGAALEGRLPIQLGTSALH